MSDDRGKKPKKDKRDKHEKDAVSPWLAGVSGVKGVVPPGRRLSPPSERRSTAWSASGVRGVTPPGHQKVGDGPAAESAAKAERKRALRQKAAARAYEEAKRPPRANADAPARGAVKPAGGAKARGGVDAGRPVEGFAPDPFAEVRDPKELKSFLDQLAEFLGKVKAGEHSMEGLAELVMQSHAPYEIIVGFSLLSALVGRSSALRRRYTAPLERGAKAFFNLAIRLNRNVKAPRGLVPETLDAIFYDLPASAYQVPFAWATDAFVRAIELLRGDEETDRALVRFARELRGRYIETRALGDEPLAKLFPWAVPDWAPEDDEDDEPARR